LGFTGATAVWFSQPALFVTAGFTVAFVLLTVRARSWQDLPRLFVLVSLWSANAAVVAWHSFSNVSDLDRQYFSWFWNDGFMPLPPRHLADVTWLPGKLIWVFGAFELGLGRTHGGLNYRWSPVFSVMMALGFWALWRQRREVAGLLLFPVLMCVIASALKIYPFTARLIAFVIPYLLVATAAGAGHALSHWPRRFQALIPIVLAILGGAPLYAIATALPPSRTQHIRPILREISRRHEPTDRIYVYYGARPAFDYYARGLGIRLETARFGRCQFADPREYLREVDAFRGSRRMWLVATHMLRNGEVEMMTRYLDRIGRRLDSIIIPGSNRQPIEAAVGFLYDLSDPSRLESVSAENFEPVLSPIEGPWRFWGCYGIVNQPPANSRPRP
jgi:hypothetical protein